MFQKRQYISVLKQIDQEHLLLIKIISDLETALSNNAPNEKILEIIDAIRQAVMQHFHSEEELMANYNFGNSIPHRKEHLLLFNQINTLALAVFKEEEPKRKANLVELFLRHWLMKHIAEYDQELMNYVAEKQAQHRGAVFEPLIRIFQRQLKWVLGEANTDLRGLLFPWFQSNLIEVKRASLIVSRVRLLAGLFALLTPLWICHAKAGNRFQQYLIECICSIDNYLYTY